MTSLLVVEVEWLSDYDPICSDLADWQVVNDRMKNLSQTFSLPRKDFFSRLLITLSMAKVHIDSVIKMSSFLGLMRKFDDSLFNHEDLIVRIKLYIPSR